MKSTIILLLVLACWSLTFADTHIYHQGKDKYDSGNYSEAVKFLLQYLEENPKEAEVLFAERMLSEAYVKLGDEYLKKGDVENAKSFYYAANSMAGNDKIEKYDQQITDQLLKEKEQEKRNKEKERRKEREDAFDKEAVNYIETTKSLLSTGKYDEVIKAYDKYRNTRSKGEYRRLAEKAYIVKATAYYNDENLRQALDILNLAKNDLGTTSNDFNKLHMKYTQDAKNALLEPESMEEARKSYKPVCYLREVLFKPGDYIDKYCEIQGVIFQNISEGFLLEVQGRKIYCVYKGEKLFVDNVPVKAIGIVLGVKTYQTTSGGSNTVPKVLIIYVESFM